MKFVKMDGKKLFPSKIICVGINFPLHIKEMGGCDKRPAEPVIFLKPNSSVAFEQEKIVVPESFGVLHHEVELCFCINKDAKDVDASKASEFIGGYGVGIDLTLREIQSRAKQAGLPWSIAKGFDSSAVFGKFVPAGEIPAIGNLDMMLAVNGEVRQHSNASEMIFSPEEILSFASRFMTIEAGDIFMCGTPHGVGELASGDRVLAEISHLPPLEFEIVRS